MRRQAVAGPRRSPAAPLRRLTETEGRGRSGRPGRLFHSPAPSERAMFPISAPLPSTEAPATPRIRYLASRRPRRPARKTAGFGVETPGSRPRFLRSRCGIDVARPAVEPDRAHRSLASRRAHLAAPKGPNAHDHAASDPTPPEVSRIGRPARSRPRPNASPGRGGPGARGTAQGA